MRYLLAVGVGIRDSGSGLLINTSKVGIDLGHVVVHDQVVRPGHVLGKVVVRVEGRPLTFAD